MPVPMLANTQGHHHDAGQHEPQVGVPAPALDRGAEQEHEQRHEDDRCQRDVEELLWLRLNSAMPGRGRTWSWRRSGRSGRYAVSH